LSINNLKLGIAALPHIAQQAADKASSIEQDINNVGQIFSISHQQEISRHEKRLRDAVTKVVKNPAVRIAYHQQELTRLGISLIDDKTTACPLCDKPWQHEELLKHLENKLSLGEIGEQLRGEIFDASKVLREYIDSVTPSLQRLATISQQFDLLEQAKLFGLWLQKLEDLLSVLKNPVNKLVHSTWTQQQIAAMLADESTEKAYKIIAETAQAKFPKATPEQNAWETLIRLEENLKALDRAERAYQVAELTAKRSEKLVELFQAARDTVLGELFESIQERFEALYQNIHHTDEDDFKAKLEHVGAGITLEVDFHGLGTHPPQALHSEGHQDSMGLCLFLALSEKLTADIFDFIILDDVVMSVDAEHRRELCKLLKTQFPDKQFIITTHDKTWATQLKFQGVVNSRGLIELFDWKLDTGPRSNLEADLWNKIAEDLKIHDVPSAAARLRRSSEQFYSQVCYQLQALVPFNPTGSYDLGILLNAAQGQFGKLLSKAKDVANSWGDQDAMGVLNEVSETHKTISTRINSEQWAINPNVHYNNWANFSATDFQPVVEAFRDLSHIFICSKCGAIIEVINQGVHQVTVTCTCGKINWNLRKKR
jgi:hypothetical protein